MRLATIPCQQVRPRLLVVLVAVLLLPAPPGPPCSQAAGLPSPADPQDISQHTYQHRAVEGGHHHVMNKAWIHKDTGAFIHLKYDVHTVRDT
jgi:hypothetical protein